jgi:hypothetical protein
MHPRSFHLSLPPPELSDLDATLDGLFGPLPIKPQPYTGLMTAIDLSYLRASYSCRPPVSYGSTVQSSMGGHGHSKVWH